MSCFQQKPIKCEMKQESVTYSQGKIIKRNCPEKPRDCNYKTNILKQQKQR